MPNKSRRSRRKFVNYRKQRDVLEAETRALQSTIEEIRAESAQLAAKLGTERAGRSADRQRLQGLDQVLDELRGTKDALSKSQHRIERLFTALKIWRRNSTGLQRFQSILKGRFENVSRGLLQAGAALQQGEAERPSIIDAISEDIREINHPSIWWRVARGFGLLRLARPGLPRTTADRKALASDLKAVLRAIRKTLSAKATAPEDTVIAMSRLFQLRRITHQFARSIDLRMLLRGQAPAWNRTQWTQPSAAAASARTPAAVLFDAPWYLAQYSDVAASGVDPLTHYLKWGAREGRNPNAVFDTDWYLVQNPDVAVAGLNPLEHYLQEGAREGRDPSPLFSSTWYLAQNQDVAAAGVNPFQHYLEYGARRRTRSSSTFRLRLLPGAVPGSRGTESGGALSEIGRFLREPVHIRFSMRHGTWPRIQTWLEAGENPLLHYLDRGWLEGRSPHPLFDSDWYLAENPGVSASGMNPLLHYVKFGAAEGRNPNPLFDSAWYNKQTPEAGTGRA